MALSTATATTLSTLVPALGTVLNHHSSTTAAATPIALIKSGVNVAANAQLLANLLISSNPAAASTAEAIAANPAEAAVLIGTLEQELNAQSTNVLTAALTSLGL